MEQSNSFFGTEKVSRLLLRLAPPVMLAQLIQALYNIVDSYFIGQYSKDGLAALSVIFPIQLLISALAIGTGVGVNTLMSKYYGMAKEKEAKETAGVGFFLSVVTWVIFAAIFCGIMGIYTKLSLSTPQAQNYACTYGRIVCGFSFGIFLESNWSKILQSKGGYENAHDRTSCGSGYEYRILIIFIRFFDNEFFKRRARSSYAIQNGVDMLPGLCSQNKSKG